MDTGVILLFVLALLVAWGINRIARALHLPKVGYVGIVVVFILVVLALWADTFPGSR